MKLNYYLRGLGIGVVVTSLLMGVSVKPEAMTDEQIKARARQLGMIEESEQVVSEVLPAAGSTKNENTQGKSLLNGVVSDNDGKTEESSLASGQLAEMQLPGGQLTDKEKSAEESLAELPDKDLKVGTKADEAEDGQALAKAEKSSSSSNAEKKKESSSSSNAEKKKESSSSSDAEKNEKKSSSSEVEKKEERSSSSNAEKKEKSSSSSDIEKKEKSSSSSDAEKKEKSSSSSDAEKKEKASSSAENLVSGSAGTVSITIDNGMGSYQVAQALVNAGVVDNAAAFDNFLCENGYDRHITTGLKVIPKGASNVEIAGIITVK